MKIFIDVDNTLLEHSGFYTVETEGRIHSSIGKFPVENEQAISAMYESSISRNPDIVARLFKLDNVFILTKYPAIEYEIHKQKKLAAVLGISHDELINAKNSQGIPKYINLHNDASKVETVKELFNIPDLSNCILIDDYSSNIIEWSNNKGLGIKYYNEYNSPTHPIKGLAISNFKLFEPMLDNKNAKQLMFSCEDPYKLSFFLKSLDNRLTNDNLDILREVYHNLKQKQAIAKVDVNSKYNLRNFLIEYYHFIDSLDPNYWQKILKDKLAQHKTTSIVSASFDIDFKKLDLFADESALAIKILDQNKTKSRNIYDIYITLDPNAFVDNIDYNLHKLSETLESFLLVE